MDIVDVIVFDADAGRKGGVMGRGRDIRTIYIYKYINIYSYIFI